MINVQDHQLAAAPVIYIRMSNNCKYAQFLVWRAAQVLGCGTAEHAAVVRLLAGT
jgi:hypothetical protein